MKELLAKHKDKLIKAIIGLVIAVVAALFGYKVSDILPSEKTEAIVNANVPPVLAPGETAKPEEKK
jgi:hypothetical protein